MEPKKFYITTTLPYANGAPHVGHTMEFIRADIIARHKRQQGARVFFNTGTDEHGQKIAENAEAQGQTPQVYVDQIAGEWKDFCKSINMSYDFFSRTTNSRHIKSAQELWKRCAENGFIYKKDYQTKYCVGCELEKQDGELADGACPDHSNREIELIDEENYFFAFSKLEKELLNFYKQGSVLPQFRENEIKGFVEGGLQDFSISRLKEKMSWGVPVPGDDEHVMYVWFDALTSYISCLGWGTEDANLFDMYWKDGETLQLCGKDNLRQQTAIWQAMLMAAGLPTTNTIFIEGHIVSGGKKMSKSVGNVVDPFLYIEKYGIDAVRYYIARHVHNTQDSDWTAESFHEAYQANLVNGIGNLTNRILKMSSSYGVTLDEPEIKPGNELLDTYDFSGALDEIFKFIGSMDQFITDEAPFKKVKTDPDAAAKDVQYLLEKLWEVTMLIAPIMPETYGKMRVALEENQKPTEPLFPRVELQ